MKISIWTKDPVLIQRLKHIEKEICGVTNEHELKVIFRKNALTLSSCYIYSGFELFTVIAELSRTNVV